MNIPLDKKVEHSALGARLFLGALLAATACNATSLAAEAGRHLPAPASAETRKVQAGPVLADEKKESGFSFSLLPKSLQKNPQLELTVITEMTDEGKKLPPVSQQQPAYYVLQASGFHEFGDFTSPSNPMTATELQGVLQKSLAANGYLPAPAGPLRPTLLIVYTWGAYNGGKSEPIFGERQAFLNRAMLVGGQKFARQMVSALEAVDAMVQAGVPTDVILFVNGVHQYETSDPKHALFVDQAEQELYYVVASAYDYASAASNRRRLLWRTRMTVNSAGLSLTQSLPPLITSAAPFFGRDMPEPESVIRRVRDGKVEIGAPTVVEPSDVTPPPQAP
jgi:hypothetical protein